MPDFLSASTMLGAFLHDMYSEISKALSRPSGKIALPSCNSIVCPSMSASTFAGMITSCCSRSSSFKANWSRLTPGLSSALSACSERIAD